jgi:hypothetical protein
MKRSFAILMFGSALLVVSGCGDSGRVTSNAPGNSKQTDQAPAGNPSPNPASEGSLANSDRNEQAAQPFQRKRGRDEDRTAAPEATRPAVETEEMLKRSTRPAPENSEFAVALTDILVERRTFNGHPVLSRVEKRTAGEQISIEVRTTDGAVRTLSGNAIPALSTVPTARILELIGRKPAPARESNVKPRAREGN